MDSNKREREEVQSEELSAKVVEPMKIGIGARLSDQVARTSAVVAVQEMARFRGIELQNAQQRRYIGELQAINDALKADNMYYYERDEHMAELQRRNKYLDEELTRTLQQLDRQNALMRRLGIKHGNAAIDNDTQ